MTHKIIKLLQMLNLRSDRADMFIDLLRIDIIEQEIQVMNPKVHTLRNGFHAPFKNLKHKQST